MTPSRLIFEEIGTLLAADTATLAAVAAMKLHLAKQPFVPSLDLDVTTLTEATFPGYAALLAGTGTQKVYYDIATGLYSIEILEPAGGWHFQSTGVPAPAETIYGYWLADNGGTHLYGSALLTPALTVNKSGQGLDVANLTFRFLPNSPN